jgi:putative hydrolase of HD superfamily
LNLKFEKRKGWITRKFENIDIESVADHVLGAFYIADIMLPPESDIPDYKKSTILETLLYHDLAESKIGDKLPDEKTEDIRNKEEEFYSKLASCSALGYYNVQHIKDLWINFESKNINNINAYIAYEIDKLEAYAQLLSYLRKGQKITKEDFDNWRDGLNIVKTEYGLNIKEFIEKEFENIISEYTKKNG